jgi:putative RecB family exonuclease
LYHYRVIEKSPEPISLDAVRGTLIHNILEKLLGLSSEERTIEKAKKEVPVHWDILKNQIPDLAQYLAKRSG